MAKQQTASRRKARPQDNGSDKGKSGSGDKASSYEEELTELLQERIKPNLNRGSIPLLARSLAKDIASRQRPDEAEEDDQPEADDEAPADRERDEEPEADAGDDSAADEEPDEEEDPDEEPKAEADDEELADEDDESEDEEEPEDEEESEDPVSAFEEEMHQLQEDLGDEWIVRFSVQNDEAWLTAEKEDGSQHVEGPTADVLREAVELLEGGGESDED